jgi:hypothetical protein
MQQMQMSFDVPSLDGEKWRDWLEIQAKGRLGVRRVLAVFSSAQIVQQASEKPGESAPGSEWEIGTI